MTLPGLSLKATVRTYLVTVNTSSIVVMTMIRWMIVLLSFLQCIWITHCFLYIGTPFRHSIHWTIPHSTTTTTITTTTNSHAIFATQKDNIFTDSQKLNHHQHSRSTYLFMQSRRSPQSSARPTTPSSSSVSGSSESAYLLPTPPVNSIGNFFDQSTLVPSSSSSSSDDSGSDSSGGGMSFIQCHMIAVGEIEGSEGRTVPINLILHTFIYN